MLCGEILGNQGTWVYHSLSEVSMDPSQFFFRIQVALPYTFLNNL